MNSYRVHVSAQEPDKRTAYMLLGMVGSGRVQLDFGPLEVDSRKRVPNLTLSFQALYDVLQGQVLTVHRGAGTITLSPEADELIIDCVKGRERHHYRVWLAEVALGWNMLRGFTSSGIHLA